MLICDKALSSKYVYSLEDYKYNLLSDIFIHSYLLLWSRLRFQHQNFQPQIHHDLCQPVFSRVFKWFFRNIWIFLKVFWFERSNNFYLFWFWVFFYFFNNDFCLLWVKNCCNYYIFCRTIHFLHCLYVRSKKNLVSVFDIKSWFINWLHNTAFVYRIVKESNAMTNFINSNWK